MRCTRSCWIGAIAIVMAAGPVLGEATTPVLEGLAVRETGPARTETIPFSAWDSDGVIRLYNGGEGGNYPAAASAFVWVNGAIVAKPFHFNASSSMIEFPFRAGVDNELQIRLAGKPGGTLEYRLYVEGAPRPPGCLAGVPLAGPSVLSDWPFGDAFASLEFFPTRLFFDPAFVPPREPSGVVYVPDFERFFMVDDEAALVPLSRDLVADERRAVRTNRDPEGITYDPATNLLYLVTEKDGEVLEYSYETGALERTGRQWDLSSIVPITSSDGPAGLAYVPTDASNEGGVFYVGSEADGMLRIVELDLLADGDDGYGARLWEILDPPAVNGLSPGEFEELSALHYEPASGFVFAVWRDDVHLVAVLDSATNEWVHVFSLETAGQTGNEEGFAFDDQCRVFLADDKFGGREYGRVRRFSSGSVPVP